MRDTGAHAAWMSAKQQASLQVMETKPMALSRTEEFRDEVAERNSSPPPFHIASLLSSSPTAGKKRSGGNRGTGCAPTSTDWPLTHTTTSASPICGCSPPLPLPPPWGLPSSGYQSPSSCYCPHPSFHFYQVPFEQSFLPPCWVEEPASPPANRYRTLYTRRQLEILEGVFSEKKYVTLEERNRIAKDVGVSEKQVRMWFQNRRTRLKKEASRGVGGENSKASTNVHEHLKLKIKTGEERRMTSSSKL